MSWDSDSEEEAPKSRKHVLEDEDEEEDVDEPVKRIRQEPEADENFFTKFSGYKSGSSAFVVPSDQYAHFKSCVEFLTAQKVQVDIFFGDSIEIKYFLGIFFEITFSFEHTLVSEHKRACISASSLLESLNRFREFTKQNMNLVVFCGDENLYLQGYKADSYECFMSVEPKLDDLNCSTFKDGDGNDQELLINPIIDKKCCFEMDAKNLCACIGSFLGKTMETVKLELMAKKLRMQSDAITGRAWIDVNLSDTFVSALKKPDMKKYVSTSARFSSQYITLIHKALKLNPSQVEINFQFVEEEHEPLLMTFTFGNSEARMLVPSCEEADN